MSESTALTVAQGSQVALWDGTPDEIIERSASMARSLQQMVEQAGLSRSFGGQKRHLDYEAWLTLGRFFGASPVTEWTRPIERSGQVVGYECRVNVVDAQGRVIGGAEGCCMFEESNWKGKPEYAVKSMAQTRTAGKALRSVFGFVAVLAGYSGTPSEEMSNGWEHGQGQRPPQTTHRPQAAQGDGKAQGMAAPQRRKLWSQCMQAGLSKDDAATFVKSLNIGSVREASQAIENFDANLRAWRGDPAPVDAEPVFDDDVPF